MSKEDSQAKDDKIFREFELRSHTLLAILHSAVFVLTARARAYFSADEAWSVVVLF